MEDYIQHLGEHTNSRGSSISSVNFLYGPSGPIFGSSSSSGHGKSSGVGLASGTGFHLHQSPGGSGDCYDHQHQVPVVKTRGGSTSQSNSYGGPNPNLHYHPAAATREHFQGHMGEEGESRNEVDAMKAKIIAHPHYSNLLEAYMDCQKVGAPPEVVARMAEVRHDFVTRQRVAAAGDDCKDPELDQFMEAYYDMLVKYREELTKPLQEATEFMRRIETQLNMLTNDPVRIFNSEDKGGDGGSSEEDPDNTSGGEAAGVAEIDPRAEDRELKNHLLQKYSGYLSSLKQELSKKKKKGKLPKDARQKLLTWWELHYKWPYPSESEKVGLAASTGLDQKQINNWFINQRKRHWKPSEDMQFMVVDGFGHHHPQQAAATALYCMGDGGPYRLGP